MIDPYMTTEKTKKVTVKSKSSGKGVAKTVKKERTVLSFQLRFEKFLDKHFFNPQWEDGAFMDDVRQATLRGVHPMVNVLFKAMVGFVLFFIIWASFAKLDEVTSGLGSVIPSGKVQIVQNLEGGIIKEINVWQGLRVEVGDILLVIDDTGFASSLEEKRDRLYGLQAKAIRLEAEIAEKAPVFPKKLKVMAPDIVSESKILFKSSQGELASARDILKRQVEQRRQEFSDAKQQKEQTYKGWDLARQEYDMAVPLEAQGVISKVELLRLERDVADMKSRMASARLGVPKAFSALKESQSRLEETILRVQNEMRAELAEVKEELNRLSEGLKAEADKVDRTIVRAPVRAEVKQVLVNTVGGVVQPGMDLVELIPLDDTLLVEAKVRPQDIAFIRSGQEAMVKITAYDFSIYGGLEGIVERISPDTITDEKGDAFYKIMVRTQKNYLGENLNKLPIISGMVASVDILTGKKTVLDYLLKPLNKAREKALRER